MPIHDRDEQTLLRELTHRIRNELVSSINIVSAAAVRAENPEVKVALSNVVELLQQHADVQRFLTIPDRDGLVDAAEYIRKLGSAMSRSSLEPMGIRLALVADTLPLESERCWRLALAVHELVTNAARHACFDGREGAIKIKLSLADPVVNCIVADNGSLSARLKPARGLQMVSDLTKSWREIRLWNAILIIPSGVSANGTRATSQPGCRVATCQGDATTQSHAAAIAVASSKRLFRSRRWRSRKSGGIRIGNRTGC